MGRLRPGGWGMSDSARLRGQAIDVKFGNQARKRPAVFSGFAGRARDVAVVLAEEPINVCALERLDDAFLRLAESSAFRCRRFLLVARRDVRRKNERPLDRRSTRLNSSHVAIS